eukprot:g4340.t1
MGAGANHRRVLALVACAAAVAASVTLKEPKSCTRGQWRSSTMAPFRRRRSKPREVQAECIPCAPGHMMPLYHHSESVCFACASGLWTDTAGSAECKGVAACAAGSWGIEAATKPGYPCHLCAAGRFQVLAGQDRCRACSPGTYSASEGASLCQEATAGGCPAGTRGRHAATSPAQALCEPCAADTANPHPGGECHSCPAGKHQPSSGSTQCEDMPVCARFYALNENTRECELRHAHLLVLVTASWVLCVLSCIMACMEDEFPLQNIITFITCMGVGICVTQKGEGFVSSGSFWSMAVALGLSALAILNHICAVLRAVCCARKTRDNEAHHPTSINPV